MNKDKEMDLLNGKKYNIITFGCQMNEHDSETIAGMLQEKGCVETMSRDDSDITIINTCSVRENADKRFFGTLGRCDRSAGRSAFCAEGAVCEIVCAAVSHAPAQRAA